MRGILTIEADVLEVEHRKGEFVNGEGQTISFDFHTAHLLVGREVVGVRFNPDNADTPLPSEGDTVRLEVEVPKGTKVVARRNLAPAKVGTPPVRAAG